MIRYISILIVATLSLVGCGATEQVNTVSTETVIKTVSEKVFPSLDIACPDISDIEAPIKMQQVLVSVHSSKYDCRRADKLVRYFLLHNLQAPESWYAANFGGCEWSFIPKSELHRLKIKYLDATWSKYEFVTAVVERGCNS